MNRRTLIGRLAAVVGVAALAPTVAEASDEPLTLSPETIRIAERQQMMEMAERGFATWAQVAPLTLKGVTTSDDRMVIGYRQSSQYGSITLRDYCYPCSSKAFSGLGSYPWTCGNGHTLTSSADVWSGMPRVFSDEED